MEYMSTDMMWQTSSGSSDDTEKLGRELGSRLRGGEVFELASDLGGGKTTFVRGLVAGTGSDEAVASPSFTLSRIYICPKFTVHHFDFYRLPDPGLMSYELAEALDGHDVVVVEWADMVGDVLSADRIKVHIKNIGDTSRELSFRYPSSFSYLFHGANT